jgi:hypothetical protein
MKVKALDLTAVLVMLPFVGFWLWFGIASAVSEELGARNWAAHLAVPGGIFVATLLLAVRWRRAGAALLLLEGLAVAIAYPLLARGRFPLSTIALILLTMAFPPAVAGSLLLLGGHEGPDAARSSASGG